MVEDISSNSEVGHKVLGPMVQFLNHALSQNGLKKSGTCFAHAHWTTSSYIVLCGRQCLEIGYRWPGYEVEKAENLNQWIGLYMFSLQLFISNHFTSFINETSLQYFSGGGPRPTEDHQTGDLTDG